MESSLPCFVCPDVETEVAVPATPEFAARKARRRQRTSLEAWPLRQRPSGARLARPGGVAAAGHGASVPWQSGSEAEAVFGV